MKLSWKFWQKKAASFATLNSENPFLEELGLLAYSNIIAATAHGALALYRRSSAVSIPIRLIANNVSMIKPVLIKKGEVVLEHDLLKLLMNPSTDLSANLFFKSLSIFHSVTGQAFVWAGGNINKPPLALDVVNPINVSINADLRGGILSIDVTSGPYQGNYKAQNIKGSIRYVLNEFSEIGLIRSFSSMPDERSFVGESPLKNVAMEIQQLVEGSQHNSALLRNGGRLSLLFSLKEELSPDQYEAAKSAIFVQYEGTSNSGKIGVVGAGEVNVKEFGISPKDLDFKELQQLARNCVAMQYGVPIPLVDNQKSTFNNLETANEMLFDNAVEPSVREILAGLKFYLFPRFGMADFQLSFDRTELPILRARFIKELKERKEAGVETPNELRSLINREPLTQGGDDLYLPATMIPIASDQFTDDNPEVMD